MFSATGAAFLLVPLPDPGVFLLTLSYVVLFRDRTIYKTWVAVEAHAVRMQQSRAGAAPE
jgi:hypothetical protein